jgi:hypothetical protein
MEGLYAILLPALVAAVSGLLAWYAAGWALRWLIRLCSHSSR